MQYSEPILKAVKKIGGGVMLPHKKRTAAITIIFFILCKFFYSVNLRAKIDWKG